MEKRALNFFLARGLKPTALTALVISSRAAGFRGCRKSRLTQVSCVGAHSRAPLRALIKIKARTHEGTKARGPSGKAGINRVEIYAPVPSPDRGLFSF